MDKFVIRRPKRPAPDPNPDHPAPLQVPQGSLSPPPSAESDLSDLTSTELQHRDPDPQPAAKKHCSDSRLFTLSPGVVHQSVL